MKSEKIPADRSKAISDFCSLFPKEESQEKLWTLLNGYFGSKDSDDLDNRGRSDYLLFYKLLASVIDTMYEL